MDQAIAFAQKGFDDKDPPFVLLAPLWQGYDRLREIRDSEIVIQLELPDWST